MKMHEISHTGISYSKLPVSATDTQLPEKADFAIIPVIHLYYFFLMKKALLVLPLLLLLGAGCGKGSEKSAEAPKPEPTKKEQVGTAPEKTPTVTEVTKEDSKVEAPTKEEKPVAEVKKEEVKPVVPEKTTPPVTQAVKSFNMTAKQWSFEPSTITVNKGDKVKLTIQNIDVTHGFGLTEFGINRELTPGKTEMIEFTADKAGTFSFFCSKMCGSGHKSMKGTLIVK